MPRALAYPLFKTQDPEIAFPTPFRAPRVLLFAILASTETLRLDALPENGPLPEFARMPRAETSLLSLILAPARALPEIPRERLVLPFVIAGSVAHHRLFAMTEFGKFREFV